MPVLVIVPESRTTGDGNSGRAANDAVAEDTTTVPTVVETAPTVSST